MKYRRSWSDSSGLSLYFQIKKGGPVVIIIFSQHSIIFCRLWLKLLILQAMDAIKKLYSSLPKDDIKRLEKEVTYICLLQLNRLPCSIALVVWFLIFPSYRLMIWQKKKKISRLQKMYARWNRRKLVKVEIRHCCHFFLED